MYSVQDELQKQLEGLKRQQEKNKIDVENEKGLENQETEEKQDSKGESLSDIEKESLNVY
ncbi:hypothetical protein D9O40_18395 [Clostridium autoethanogenum]|uniref:Uncharacterized protein n=1 Tax=Clostridium autoethanogenum TaxID=84023 RepID=A0A3M0S3F8_9CLOT|nr:hypothetical protein [Clostridium autoethanogenum]RMC93046.1 hypothetical protein D9O40_18395 [Clostridium autoethanogenum]